MNTNVRVYRPTVPDGYEWAIPVEAGSSEILVTAGREDGVPWAIPELHLLRVVDGSKQLRRAVLPWLGSFALVLRDEAIDTIGPLLSDYGQLLPLLSPDARLSLFAARLVPGAISLEKSEIVRSSDGEIMYFQRPVFNDEVIAEAGAFKLPEMPRGDVYFTERLVDAIRATGCDTGTKFELVYDSTGPQ